MSDTTHTPGPWELTTFPAEWDITTDKLTYLCKGFGRQSESSLANARLIAAAPELLFAMSSLVACISETRGPDATSALEIQPRPK